VSVRKLAAGRNEASAGRFLGKLNEMLRDSCLSEPSTKIDEVSRRTSGNIARLKAKIESARTFLSEVEKMKADGLLDEQAAKAESLPARTVITLADMLESAYDKAKLAKNSYPLKRVNIAVQVLSGNISTSLISGTRYPKDDARLKDSLMLSRQSQAASVHEDVCRALDDVAKELGIAIPASPSLS